MKTIWKLDDGGVKETKTGLLICENQKKLTTPITMSQSDIGGRD